VAGLPIAVPSIDQSVATPAGGIHAAVGDDGASACTDLATPALPPLPALPALPIPVPLAVPALPSLSASSNACATAGLDGVSADGSLDAAGSHAQTGIAAAPPVSQEDLHQVTTEATHATGFFAGLAQALFGWL